MCLRVGWTFSGKRDMADDNASDDIISLEELVRDGASPAPSANATTTETGSVSEASTNPDNEILGNIDSVLSAEDPEFATAMGELQSQLVASGGEIDSLDLTGMTDETPVRGFRGGVHKFLRLFSSKGKDQSSFGARLKRLRTSLVALLKDGIKYFLIVLKNFFIWLGVTIKETAKAAIHLPLKSQLMVGAVMLLGGALVYVMILTFGSQILPRLEADFLVSFANVADQKFTYSPDDPMEDFNNPLLHPEHVVLLERLVVNLRPEEGSNPMGVFELYIETATQDVAIEIKDREIEVRDLVNRVLEQMTYEELVTMAGKNRLKTVLRKNLNDFLSKGRVRRVFFKSVVLKP